MVHMVELQVRGSGVGRQKEVLGDFTLNPNLFVVTQIFQCLKC